MPDATTADTLSVSRCAFLFYDAVAASMLFIERCPLTCMNLILRHRSADRIRECPNLGLNATFSFYLNRFLPHLCSIPRVTKFASFL